MCLSILQIIYNINILKTTSAVMYIVEIDIQL
jgi:hypothetical protein